METGEGLKDLKGRRGGSVQRESAKAGRSEKCISSDLVVRNSIVVELMAVDEPAEIPVIGLTMASRMVLTSLAQFPLDSANVR